MVLYIEVFPTLTVNISFNIKLLGDFLILYDEDPKSKKKFWPEFLAEFHISGQLAEKNIRFLTCKTSFKIVKVSVTDSEYMNWRWARWGGGEKVK